MDFEGVRVVGHDANFYERLFLEVWFSIKDLQSGNDHIAIPKAYKSVFEPVAGIRASEPSTISLVLTYHPTTQLISRNFHLLPRDPDIAAIF